MRTFKDIFAIIPARGGSKGIRNKNLKEIDGIPLIKRTINIAKESKFINRIFVSTDSQEIATLCQKSGADIIHRPTELGLDQTSSEDVLIHAYKEMIKSTEKPSIIVLLFANNPAISIDLVKQGIKKLTDDESYDSAFSVSKYNMFSPPRARKLVDDKIESFVPLNLIGKVNSIRSSQGDVYFCDLSVQVIRSRVFENMQDGMQPFQWMGKKSFPLKNSYGFDIDEEWQKTAIEVWLKKNWKYE